MNQALSDRARALLNDRWRLTPARMAEHLTRGGFRRFAHIRHLERKIAEAAARKGARLVISLPPRHGKSWLASLFTPAWYLSLWPDRHVVLASHDARVAAAWGRAVRALLQRHENELAISLLAGPKASPGWNTSRGGGLVTAAVGGPILSPGGQLMIIDDPLKSWKEAASENVRRNQLDWFHSTFCTRAEPGASFIVIMTRWHEQDLGGCLASEPGWEVLRIPALAEAGDCLNRAPGTPLCPERYDLAALARLRAEIGGRLWNTLYQQRPESASAGTLKRSWWRRYRQVPEKFDELVQSWDLTFKDGASCDYVVGQVWGRIGAEKYLIDQVRGRMDFLSTVEAVRALSHRYPKAHRKLIEDKANGSALISLLRPRLSGLIPVMPDGSKTARVAAISAEIESGNVFLPEAMNAPWIEDFITECAAFPGGPHDDQVDAMTCALTHLKRA